MQLNGITLGQTQTFKTASKCTTYIEKSNLGLVNLVQFDPINRMVPLNMFCSIVIYFPSHGIIYSFSSQTSQTSLRT